MLQSLLHRAWHSAISIYRLFTMNANKIPRILSIQSHVVSGYVGNKSAIFPLQVLGFEVDSINSVQLSNHTGYKVFKGQVLNDKDLEDLISGLIENNLTDYTHLLTGYVGSASFLRKIAEVIHILKRKNPDLIYVCDPVMGDNGKMYVPEQLKEIYKREIVPLADIVIPNQFELELLSDIKVTELSSLQKAIDQLHKLGPKTVSVSSTEVDEKLTAVFSASNKVMKVDIPKIPTSFTGSGDLFAALFLAYSYLEDDIKGAIEKTVNSLYQVLLNTYTHSQECQGKEMPAARRIELRLIQSKKFIENPEIVLFAAPLT